jgi:hypothetical protein
MAMQRSFCSSFIRRRLPLECRKRLVLLRQGRVSRRPSDGGLGQLNELFLELSDVNNYADDNGNFAPESSLSAS